MAILTDLDQLEARYGTPGEASLVKELDHLIPEYERVIRASPFVILGTAGPEGLDCSPRGDVGQVVTIADARTLLLPDRRGNNRTDSLRNIVRDPRVALLFLVPGSDTTLRVNGHAEIEIDPDRLAAFAREAQVPRSLVVIHIERVYFQCARALLRAELWNPDHFVAPGAIPTPGEMLSACSDNRVGGEGYDREWPERARKSMW